MKHPIAAPLAVITLSLSTACLPAFAQGPVVSESRNVPTFDAVQVSGACTVHIKQSASQRLTVKAPQSQLSELSTEVHAGRLEISHKGSGLSRGRCEVQITTPMLKQLRVSGAVHARAFGLKAEALEISSSGASEITLSGAVQTLVAELSGASDVNALGLKAERVTVETSGASDVKVHAQTHLKVRASGASSVRYAGAPKQVERDLSGASDCKPI